ncbi:hypothetical protein DFH09DRAFT_297186 [Mycena vulgaris]|nr:hypothetical protein DFH09DRAFT_297186 [Mycena vulgaris]
MGPLAVKCQWYDDDGNPLASEGCRYEGAGCKFIHPSSPQWSSAIRKLFATVNQPISRSKGPIRTISQNRGRGRGRGWGGAAPSRDNGWAGGKRKSSSEWDTDGWKPKTFANPPDSAASPVLSSNGPEASTSKVLGQWGDSSSGSGWGDTSSGSGGWGSGGWGETTSTGGWGSGAWGDSASTGETTTGDLETGTGWGTGTGGWGESSIANTGAQQDTIVDPPATQPTRPTVDTDIRMAVDASAPPQSASSYRATSQAPSERTPQSAFPPFAIPASVPVQNMTRSQLHSGIIKNSVRATRIRLELQELRRQLANWKTTQLSHQFHRVSAGAGKRLDGIRTGLSTQISSVEGRLKQAEEELLRFPELPSSAPKPIDVDKEMMQYTEELRAWLQSFAALAVSAPNPPFPSDPSAMDVDLNAKPEAPLSLLAEIEDRMAKLEDQLVETEQAIQDPDTVSSQRNARLIDETLEAARTASKPNDRNKGNGGEETESVLQSTSDELEGKVLLQAEQVALLLEKNAIVKQRITVLEAQRDQRRRLKLAMQSHLEQFETWEQERRKQLAAMSEQLTRLANQHPETTPVLDEGVLLHARAAVDAMIQTEVLPALGALGVQYAEAFERRMKSLQLSIQPALDKTNEICETAESMVNT